MKLHIETTFPADLDAVWDIFLDHEFEARLERASGVLYESIDTETMDGVECRRIKVTARKPLPRVIARVLRSNHLSYTQITYLDRPTNTLEWEVIPMAFADQFTAKGVTTLYSEEHGCRRVIDGNISVRIPLVGGAIEKAILRDVTDSFEKASAMALDLLNERAAS